MGSKNRKYLKKAQGKKKRQGEVATVQSRVQSKAQNKVQNKVQSKVQSKRVKFSDHQNPEAGCPVAKAEPKTTYSPKLSRTALLIDLTLVLAFAVSICFYDLNSPSISYRDETTHISAIQAMHQSGDWWRPTVRGNLYFNKPPLKMWLTFIPLRLFGESAFSYRFLDALAGVLTCLMLFTFARIEFRSRIASIVAPLALLSCYSYIFGHGVRKAVQDSFMIMLSTGALLVGWYVLKSLLSATGNSLPLKSHGPKTNSLAVKSSLKPSLKPALLCGALIGCAILTKSAAGTIPLGILGLVFLLTKAYSTPVRSWLPLALGILLPALTIPALFYVPHFIFTPGALETVLGQEITNRVTTGYHNKDAWWFYLERIFIDGQAVPPELLVLSAVFVFSRLWLGDRTPLAKLLLCWSLLPILVFSIIPSRLTWYISPTYPAMSLMVAWLCSWFYDSNFTFPTRLRNIALAAVLLSIGSHQIKIVQSLSTLTPRIPFDRIATQVAKEAKTQGGDTRVLSFRAPAFALHESTYGQMLGPITDRVESEEQFKEALSSKRHRYLLTDIQTFEQLAAADRVSAYRYFPPFYDRFQWLVFSALKISAEDEESFSIPELQLTRQFFNFGESLQPVLFGFAEQSSPTSAPSLEIRQPRSAFSFNGDSALKHLGAKIALSIVGRTEAKLEAKIFINTVFVYQFILGRSDFQTERFSVPANIIANGTNTLYIELAGVDGKQFEDTPNAMLNWVSIRLGQQTTAQQTAAQQTINKQL